ncbi:MAG: hypothetical protein E6I55_10775 [Chloroflexi bacterium]|nr:MAG: hypothetical protein E6I55_10775 [Chloroflexota bacterium]
MAAAGSSRVNFILRGVRVIDPLARLDAHGQDVWIDSGRIVAIYHHIDEGSVPVVDLTPAPGAEECVLCPGFIDLHTHLREPGDEEAETVKSGARAAAAGGFTSIVAMANTRPPIDTPERVADAYADGRNAASPRLVVQALQRAAKGGRPVMIHPEDEEAIAQINDATGSVVRCVERPPQVETRAVDVAIRALAHARTGRLHLQHLSTARSVEMVRRAVEQGLEVTAEVTPHHLAMWLPVEAPPEPVSLLKVNPPLRTDADRAALVHALRDGTIDAMATDHAPHRAEEKSRDYANAAPGMIGLETALATCLTLGGMGGEWIPTLVERMTAGPHRVLGAAIGIPTPRLHIGEMATAALFDPDAEWTVDAESLRSRSHNTPLLGARLKGRVLLTLSEGRVVHADAARIPVAAGEVAHA